MLTSQRKQHILNTLKRDGQVNAKQMSIDLNLSEDTIRRDLRELAQDGLLQRVHGGALPVSPAIANFAQREDIFQDEKRLIGKAAAALVKEDQVIILDGGTTAIQVARHLPSTLRATVVTHSARTALEFVEHPSIEVILIGGRLFKHSIVSVGAVALEAISHIRADIYFMGVTGIHPEVGLTTGDLEEAYVKLALSKQAAETIVLASGEKIGAASRYTIMPLQAISGMIITESVPEETRATFQHLGLSLTVARS